ncbi:OmpA/MotB domain protein [uncultured Desulfobacterium sp.]|uniref:OmpA/MotB domain protein n=1 Tax=uncultured Desulfobacterium sp. TaxID=201089 RepID=A0A445N0K2_9BACT|nr:OmpA/MotB domain protein [uncultured Desulfobacterium sp.]
MAMARRIRRDDKKNLDRWLLTYADLITLLLAFFVVMYSLSRVDAKKFGKIQEALSGILNGGPAAISEGKKAIPLPDSGDALNFVKLQSVGEAIKEGAKEVEKDTLINTEIAERGLIIHIMEQALFKSGSAELGPEARVVLDLMARKLKDMSNHIRIEGHTDNHPIHTAKYPSNWELSSDRSTQVLRYLTETHNFDPRKMSALGFGEFRPIADNDADDNRAKNRRVDIVVLTEQMSAAEPSSQHYQQ